MAFLAEIKRRRVGKVAIAYGAVAWAVTEAASVVLPALYVPEWAMTFLVIFLLVGFPIAMVLAWVFDVSATGIERTEPLPGSPPQMQFRTRAAFGVVVRPELFPCRIGHRRKIPRQIQRHRGALAREVAPVNPDLEKLAEVGARHGMTVAV